MQVCEDIETVTIADVETVKSEAKFVNESWSDLTEKLTDLQRFMINVQNELVTFDDLERKIGDLFDFIEEELNKQCFVSAVPLKCEQFEKAIKVSIVAFKLSSY